MEGVMKQRKEAEEYEVEDVGLFRRQAHVHITTTTATVQVETQAGERTNGFSGLNKEGPEFSEILSQKKEFSEIEENSGSIEKNITSDQADPVISVGSTSLTNVTTESERVGIITENLRLVKELYLESLCRKSPTQGFYCPNCRTCVQKVLLLDEATVTPPVRCPECFSFLIPLVRWLFPCWVDGYEVPTTPGGQHLQVHHSQRLLDGRGKAQILQQPESGMSDGEDKASKADDDHKTRLSSNQPSEIRGDAQGQEVPRNKYPLGRGMAGATSANYILRKRKPDVPGETKQPPQLGEVTLNVIPGATTQPSVIQEPGSTKTWEILKSVVYGGLIESIASLSIVTSSASADATTLNILVLSLANLIGGLFILINNIWDLKSEQPRADNQTNSRVDQYDEVLGRKEDFFLHVFIAILSFIIFGIVPPLVYAFTFHESNNKDLKLAAVAGASAICITLLSIAKAYTRRKNTNLTFLTVLYYLSTGAMASLVSYLTGELAKKLLEKLGWFNTESSGFTLLLPEMSMEKPRFGFY